MRTKALFLILFAVPLLQGCTTIEKVSDEDLAKGIRVAAKGAAQYGLGYVLNKEPGKAAAIADGARIAVRALRETILPAFAGEGTEGVIRSAVETALAELTGKLTPQIVLAVQLALDLIAANVKLPDNPVGKLEERTRLALVALFEGLADGLEAGTAMAPVRETVPTKLFWPKP